MGVDPLHLAVAVVPLAAYFLVLGQIHLRRRPLITTGWQDTLALGVAVSGLATAGPIELFFPDAAVSYLGPLVWILMGCLFGLLVLLTALIQRPRLVVFGADGQQLRGVAERVIAQLDPGATWSGTVCHLPSQGIQFELDEAPGMRVIQLVATSGPQAIDGWRQLLSSLRRELAGLSSRRPTRAGASWLVLGVLLLSLAIYALLSFGPSLAGPVQDMLRW